MAIELTFSENTLQYLLEHAQKYEGIEKKFHIKNQKLKKGVMK